VKEESTSERGRRIVASSVSLSLLFLLLFVVVSEEEAAEEDAVALPPLFLFLFSFFLALVRCLVFVATALAEGGFFVDVPMLPAEDADGVVDVDADDIPPAADADADADAAVGPVMNDEAAPDPEAGAKPSSFTDDDGLS